jgi:hypothetical protein
MSACHNSLYVPAATAQPETDPLSCDMAASCIGNCNVRQRVTLPCAWCSLPEARLDQGLDRCRLHVGLQHLPDRLLDHPAHEDAPAPGHLSPAQQLCTAPAGLLHHVVVCHLRPVPGKSACGPLQRP